MQLTKDDLDCKDLIGTVTLDFSKFQQVVEFYEKYKDNPDLLHEEQYTVWKIFYDTNFEWIHKDSLGYNNIEIDKRKYNLWLFNYCFVEGLK